MICNTPFGSFEGKEIDGVVQYCGIQYGGLKDQMAPPELFTSYGSDVVDATEFGYVDSVSNSTFAFTLDNITV